MMKNLKNLSDANEIMVLANPHKDVVDSEIFRRVGVEQVPLYPGFERSKTNDHRRACMSNKLSLLIKNKFDAGIAGGTRS